MSWYLWLFSQLNVSLLKFSVSWKKLISILHAKFGRDYLFLFFSAFTLRDSTRIAVSPFVTIESSIIFVDSIGDIGLGNVQGLILSFLLNGPFKMLPYGWMNSKKIRSWLGKLSNKMVFDKSVGEIWYLCGISYYLIRYISLFVQIMCPSVSATSYSCY